ncbi:MAG: hypothetical protein ABF271_16395 [Abyssibacter sp.]|uniref:hypothetical protein n=1 Tax=Abyssibacter sp. TaxID=2320200 RepID=UPI00321968E1
MLKARRSGLQLARLLSAGLGGLMLLVQSAAWSQTPDADSRIEIITHPRSVDAALPQDTLRAVFSMRQQTWPNGQRVQVFVFPDHSQDHQHFCKHMLGTFPYVLRAIWDRLVFTGTGFAPIEVQSADEMRRRVNQTPGAIGYLVHRTPPHAASPRLVADTQPASAGETP